MAYRFTPARGCCGATSTAGGVDRFSPIQVECAFEVNLPDPAGGDRELVLADGRPIRYQGRADLLAGDAVTSQGDGEFRRTRVRRDRAELEAMGGQAGRRGPRDGRPRTSLHHRARLSRGPVSRQAPDMVSTGTAGWWSG